MPTIRPEGNRAGGAYASQVGGRQPARGNYPVEPAAPDSERATFQSDLRERIDGALRPIFGDYVWFGQVVDAVAPLVESENARVVREEHDRLRQEVRRWKPIRVTVEDGETVYDVHPDGEYLIRSDVLALLGESTQERCHCGRPLPCDGADHDAMAVYRAERDELQRRESTQERPVK